MRGIILLLTLLLASLPAQAQYNYGTQAPGLPLGGGAVTGPLTLSGGTPILLGAYSAVLAAPGTGYVPGDTITIAGGTIRTVAAYLTSTVLSVGYTQVVSASVAAGGTGGTSGTQTVTGTTGTIETGTFFQASVTISGGAITAINSITVAGAYAANPASLTNEPVTGAGLTGAQLNVTMGVLYASIQNSGSYSVFPSNTVTQGSTSGTGTGATFTLSAAPLAASVLPMNDQTDQNMRPGFTTRYGYLALNAQTSAGENTAFGWRVLSAATTGGFNTAMGVNAFGFLTTGANNAAFGRDAGRNNTTGSKNTFLGDAAGQGPSGGSTATSNTAVGQNALNGITTADSNVGVGVRAGRSLTTAQNNVYIGALSGDVATTGALNVAVGRGTAQVLTTGGSNVILGPLVGQTTLTTGSHNILIGTSASVDTAAAGTSSTINIENILTVTGTGTPSTSAALFAGTLDSTSGYKANGTVGVTCSGSPTASFASTLGIVTHC